MRQCHFPVIVQDQQSPNCSNGETGEVTVAYVNGRKHETMGSNGKELKAKSGDVPQT